MKTKLFFLLFFFAGLVTAQTEKFTYCLNDVWFGYDSIAIEKINEQHFGDTIIKTYKHSEKTFQYHIFNDSIFSKHEGNYYLIGANHAQIGDIWQPLWYDYFRYDFDTSQYNQCPKQRNLKVVDIEQITVGSEYRLKYKLLVLDSLQYTTIYDTPYYFYFIEGIGATSGGLYYNLAWEGMCYLITDLPTPTFKRYETDDYQHLESNCKTTSTSNLTELTNVSFNVENDYLYIQGIENEKFEVSFVDLTGKVLLKVNNQQQIDIRSLKGLIIVRLETNNGQKMVKFNWM